jgi:hypothetical protein
MAFYNYIIIDDGTDSLKYKTSSKTWHSSPLNPNTARLLLSGDLDITYGPGALGSWQGDILCPVDTQPAGWGDIDDLRTQLARRVTYQFTDHYGTLYTKAHIDGPFNEASIMPDWEAGGNDILVRIKVTAK